MTYMLQEPVKGIIFDYGATIDSNGLHWAEVIWQGYESVAFPITKENFRKAYVQIERALALHPYIQPSHNFLDLMRIKISLEIDWLQENQLIEAGDYADQKEAIARYCYQYAASCVAQAKPLLQQLASTYKLVLVSNFYGNIESVLEDFQLKELFPDIIESAVVGVRKPDPAIFALGVARMGFAPAEIVVIGDSYSKDIAPASSLGCQTIWLKGIGWDDKESLVEHDFIVTDFRDIVKYFKFDSEK